MYALSMCNGIIKIFNTKYTVEYSVYHSTVDIVRSTMSLLIIKEQVGVMGNLSSDRMTVDCRH